MLRSLPSRVPGDSGTGSSHKERGSDGADPRRPVKGGAGGPGLRQALVWRPHPGGSLRPKSSFLDASWHPTGQAAPRRRAPGGASGHADQAGASGTWSSGEDTEPRKATASARETWGVPPWPPRHFTQGVGAAVVTLPSTLLGV